MKKLFTMFAALAMAATFSANAETVEIAACSNAQHPIVRADKSETFYVAVNLNTADYGNPTVDEIATIGGSWMNPTVGNWPAVVGEDDILIDATLSNNAAGNLIATIKVTPEMWGETYNGAYHISIGFPGMTIVKDGKKVEPEYPVLDVEGNPEEGVTSACEIYLTVADETPAEFVNLYPSQEEIDNGDFTLADIYDSGALAFVFTNTVDYSNAKAVVMVTRSTGNPIQAPVNSEDMGSIWNRENQFELYIPMLFDIDDSSTIRSIRVSITGLINANGQSMPAITKSLQAAPVMQKKQKKQSSDLADSLISNNTPQNVYNMQGVLVKKNVTSLNDLNSGIYVINGQKVVVK